MYEFSLVIPLEGMECLLLAEDGLIIDPVSPYVLAQFHHHEAAYQALLANPPQRVLRGKCGHTGVGKRCSMSTPSLGSKPRLRRTPTYHLLGGAPCSTNCCGHRPTETHIDTSEPTFDPDGHHE
jgi:hypothetical protein